MRFLLTVVLIATSLVAGIGPAMAQEATPTATDLHDVAYTNVRYYLPLRPMVSRPGLM